MHILVKNRCGTFKFTFLSLIILAATAAYAGGRKDIVQLVQSGSYDDIQTAILENEDIAFTTSGKIKKTLLMTAIENNRDDTIITLLLKTGVNPGKRDKNGATALMYACRMNAGDYTTRKMITSGTFFGFQRKSRVLAIDKFGKNAFDYAKENQNKNALQILSEFTNDPSLPKQKTTETSETAYKENENPSSLDSQKMEQATLTTSEISETSSSVSTNQNKINPTLATPAEVAAANEVTEAQKKQQKNVTSPTDADQSIQTEEVSAKPYKPIYLFDFSDSDITSESVSEKTQQAIDKIPSNLINSVDQDGRTLLMNACRNNNFYTVKSLLMQGATITLQDKDGWTALMYAIRSNSDPEIIQYLINHGADTLHKNKYGITPLITAAGFSNSPETIQSLLKKHSPYDENVRKAFIAAITENRPNLIIQVFINFGLPLNDIYGSQTPLMYAAATNTSTRIISLLLQEGADSTVKTQFGKTAFSFATENSSLPKDTVYWRLNSTTTH